MAIEQPDNWERFAVVCPGCDDELLVRSEWEGREVECPHCAHPMRVPLRPDDGAPVRGEPPELGPKHRFNFGCPRCDSLLESHSGMSGDTGHCPTCGTQFEIPAFDSNTGRPGTARTLDGGAQDPVPLHAYAASGHQAPVLRRDAAGNVAIECPRCHANSDVGANTCPRCGVPFTVDGIPTARPRAGVALGVTSTVIGAIALLISLGPGHLIESAIPGFAAAGLSIGSWLQRATPLPPNSAVAGMLLGVTAITIGILTR